jgi:adenine-specific DNA-methyltransferase
MAKKPLEISSIRHQETKRLNIPTAEYEGVMSEKDITPVQVAYQRRNRDLDPQLVWRGKDEEDQTDLTVSAPPLYIQEKVHPKVLIDDLLRESKKHIDKGSNETPDLFSDFNGLPDTATTTEFYQHDQHWSNRMISGDSLAVMASLAEREGLRGKVQCIYFDPPYGIRFNSNFQWSTTSRDVKDGAKDQITREPEQVRAFRDTWRDGIHSYLSYLRDRLLVARDLLHESGSIFVQIGDENVHRVRSVLDEVFGDENFVQQIIFRTTAPLGSDGISAPIDYILWFSKNKEAMKFRPLLEEKDKGRGTNYMWTGSFEKRRRLTSDEIDEQGDLPKDLFYPSDYASSGYTATCFYEFELGGVTIRPGKKSWRTNSVGAERLKKASRLMTIGQKNRPCFIQYHLDNPMQVMKNTWMDTRSAMDKVYVVETQDEVIKRCLLMTSDPGELVLDPTCGSGTTAYVAEQWGRRWITIDTSRVSIALSRSRMMGARYPYFILSDSREGQAKEAQLTRSVPKTSATKEDVRHGFVYNRVPHIMLKNIAHNAEIDVIWDNFQKILEPLRSTLNELLSESWAEWEVPRELPPECSPESKSIHEKWWLARVQRQEEIDASIAVQSSSVYLYDKPYIDASRARVAGPFTVESLSPHRSLSVGADDELIDPAKLDNGQISLGSDFHDYSQMILENLEQAGVQQMEKANKITFESLGNWAGKGYICAEGKYIEGETERRAGIMIGPEFGSVSRADLVAGAKEAAESDFDVLIACSFNFDAASTEFDRLGRIPVLKARMNPDLMMARDLKKTTSANLFVVFGEPDIKIKQSKDNQISVQVFGVDVFKPQTGEVVSDGTDGIALWMIDTDYNEESFFVRHAYFLGANDPYKALKSTLKSEIDKDAWQSLHSDTSRPFPKPTSGRIAVKVINHLGDEVMKVIAVS